MLKIVGFGLLGLFALMVLPSSMTNVTTEPMFYGTANIVLADSDGNALMKQTVHNRITDEGETYLINQVFDTGVTQQVENSRIGALCIYETSDINIVEGTVNGLTNNLTDVSGNFCHVTTAMSNSASTSVTDAEVYTSGEEVEQAEHDREQDGCVVGDHRPDRAAPDDREGAQEKGGALGARPAEDVACTAARRSRCFS